MSSVTVIGTWRCPYCSASEWEMRWTQDGIRAFCGSCGLEVDQGHAQQQLDLFADVEE